MLILVPPVDPGGSSARVSAAGGVSSENLFESANVSVVRIVFLQLLSILVALMGFFLPDTDLMLSLRRRSYLLKLDFLKSFVRALPTSGLALGCSRKGRMLIASLWKMRQGLL